MHLLLTDRLACPRCGPGFGLILLAHGLEDRRVREGGLGCANCRDTYPVRGGVADLRAAPRGALADPPAAEPETLPGAGEIGGLLGVLRGPGQLLLIGSLARRAAELSSMIEEIEVVAAVDHAPASDADRPGVSPVVIRRSLPFQPRTMRGVALLGSEAVVELEEAARVVASGGRVAVFDARPDTAERLRDERLEIMASERGRLLARR